MNEIQGWKQTVNGRHIVPKTFDWTLERGVREIVAIVKQIPTV